MVTETNELQAGRKLDAEVHRILWPSHVLYYREDDDALWFKTNSGDPLSSKHNEVPHYSTDIAAAWQVIQHLRDTDTVPYIEIEPMRYGACEVRNCSDEFCGVEGTWSVEADTAPLAICRAALAAITFREPH